MSGRVLSLQGSSDAEGPGLWAGRLRELGEDGQEWSRLPQVSDAASGACSLPPRPRQRSGDAQVRPPRMRARPCLLPPSRTRARGGPVTCLLAPAP